MPMCGDFSSLLQLGVGTGIGLSVFRAPIDLRRQRIQRFVDARLRLLQRAIKAESKTEKLKLFTLRIDFERVTQKLDREALPLMRASVVLAFLNLSSLIYISLNAQEVVSILEEFIFLSIAVGGYLAILLVMEAIVRAEYIFIQQRLVELLPSYKIV